MTNIIFIAGFIAALFAALAYLPFGVLTWLWVAIQGPHQLIQADYQFNLAIVIACLIALIVNRKRATVWVDGTMVALAALLVHSAITTALGFVPDYSYPYFDRLWKTMFLGCFIVLFMQNRTRLQAVVWIVVLCIGLLAVKAAVFSIVTAGQFRVHGPRGSQISDNNHFAGAMCMVIPLAAYLYSTTLHKTVKLWLLGLSWAIPLGVLFTYSRGGLLSLLAVAGCFWMRSRHRLVLAAAAFGLVVVAVPLMPAHWLERMSTIRQTIKDTEQADESVQGRFNAWYVYSQLALERPLIGGGFRAPEQLWVWQRYMPESDQATGAKAAHNNFFQVLGEHGFVGLTIYLIIIALCLKNIGAVLVRARHVAELQWARQLAIACGISMVAYMVAGLTMSIPYYDLFIILTVVVATLRRLVVRELAARRRLHQAAAPLVGMPAPVLAPPPIPASLPARHGR